VVVENFLTDKAKGQRGESWNYRQDADRELDQDSTIVSSGRRRERNHPVHILGDGR